MPQSKIKAAMALDQSMPVNFGHVKGTIYGGPFKKYVPGTRRLVGIKMAEEVDHPHDFKVDTEDFSVPPMRDMQKGILYGLQQLAAGNDLYVGCMGGIGRTGLYMGCMAAVMAEYQLQVAPKDGLDPILADPVKYVRAHYKPHALETERQQNYARTFDVRPALDFLIVENRLVVVWREAPPVVQKVIVEKLVEKIVYLSPLAWLRTKLPF